eukprot:1041785-Pleurochrysis_carterae.AAC.1
MSHLAQLGRLPATAVTVGRKERRRQEEEGSEHAEDGTGSSSATGPPARDGGDHGKEKMTKTGRK